MASLVSLQGIDTAIAGLALNPETLQARLLTIIRSYFTSEESLEDTTVIPSEEIIKKLWETEAPEEIKQRRKSVSSLKSALNKRLKQLTDTGGNEEGIVISRDNIFVVSDEKKNSILEKMNLSAGAEQSLLDKIAAFRKLFPDLSQGPGGDIFSQLFSELEQSKKKIEELQEQADEAAGKTQEIEKQLQAREEAARQAGYAAGLQEGKEIAGGLLPGTRDEQGELSSEADGGSDAEEFEEIEADDIQEVPTEELQGLGAEIGEGIDAEEFEEIEADDIQQVTTEELQGLGAGIGEGIDTEELEEIEADDIQEVTTEELQGLATGIGEGIDTEEFEEIAADDIQEVTAEELPGLATGIGEGIDTEEFEEIEADDIQEVSAEEMEGLDLDEEINIEELEEIDEDDIEEIREMPETADAPQARPLDLSDYIEADQALAEEGEHLIETGEEYIAKILERFTPKFVRIPAGRYLIGSRTPAPMEQPAREVFLNSFYIGQVPVTNELFELFVRETGYETEAEKAGYGMVYTGKFLHELDRISGRATFTISPGKTTRQVAGANWRHPAGPGSSLDNKQIHPVVQVSRRDALAFAAWAGKRLPTEEEWEAGARGRDDRLFPWGNTWNAGLGNFETSHLSDTTPVKQYGRESVSPFGLYDLLGNVSEWTASTYQKISSILPGGGVRQQNYILKGGFWGASGVITIAHRRVEEEKYWSNTIGFRCAV